MNQVVHIFRKDCRSLWRVILAVLVLTFLHAYGVIIDLGSGGRATGLSPYMLLFVLAGLSVLLLPTTLFLLVVSVIQEESLVGSDKFWLTRPYSRLSLFLEKLMFVVLWAVVPMLLHDVVLIRYFGFSLSSAFGLLVWKSAQFCFFLMFAAAFAVLSASFGGALLRAIGAVVVTLLTAFVVLQSAHGAPSAEGATYGVLAVLAVAAVGAFAVVAFQYRYRITPVAALLGVAAILFLEAKAVAASVRHIGARAKPFFTTVYTLLCDAIPRQHCRAPRCDPGASPDLLSESSAITIIMFVITSKRRVKLTALLVVAAAFLWSAPARAQQHPDFGTEPVTVRLWQGQAPGAVGDTPDDIPTLTVYKPFAVAPLKGTRTGVIVAPGGAYMFLADNHEGRQVANWLNSLGITAFVLKYRVGPRYRYPVELEDMQRAIRMVRAKASDYGIAPDRIGVMGFSAGGHLSAIAGTHYQEANSSSDDPIDRMSSRPDFMVLGYPLISYILGWSNPGFRGMAEDGLLGKNNSPKLLEELSPELAVTPKTPPTFLFATSADQTLPPQNNAVVFYVALQKNHVPAELHVFQNGPHGVGLDLGDPVLAEWPVLLKNWLWANGWLVSTN